MKLSKKQINYITIFSIVFIVTIVGYFNYLMNPYNIFEEKKTQFKPYQFGYERDFINIKFKLNKNKNYVAIITGGSNTFGSFSSNTFEGLIPSNKIEYIAFDGPSTEELIRQTKLFISIHPEVKKVYYAIELNTLYSKPKESTIPEFTGLSFNPTELAKMFFSIDTTLLSLKQFLFEINTLRQNKSNITSYKYNTTLPHIRVDYFGCSIKDSDIQKIIEFSKFLKSKNIEGVFFIPAYHSLHMANIKRCSKYTEIENLKKKLAHNIQFYDFSYISPYTTVQLPEKPGEVQFHYYDDPLHPSETLGRIMLERLLNERQDFGMLITDANVDSTLERQKQDLGTYLIQNKTLIDNYMKYNTDCNSSDWQYKVVNYTKNR